MSNYLQKIYVGLATLGPVGYAPAPGTCASALTALLAYCLPGMPLLYSVPILLVFSCASAWILARALRGHAASDPSEFVLDEVVGMAWVLIGISKGAMLYSIAFLLFRLFDITKWLGVAYVERYAGWRGVLLDDVAAAVWARVLLHVCMYFI